MEQEKPMTDPSDGQQSAVYEDMLRACRLVDPDLVASPRKVAVRREDGEIYVAWTATAFTREVLYGEYFRDTQAAMRSLVTVIMKYVSTPTQHDERMLVLYRRWYLDCKVRGHKNAADKYCHLY